MSPASVPLEQYLSTSYSPDVDYVDGRIEKRNVGEKEHSKLQLRMAILLMQTQAVIPFIEARLRVSATRYRIPDVCAYEQEPDEAVFTQPPVLCVEIVSPEDRLSRIAMVIEDYRAMGVPTIWVLDPLGKKAYVADSEGFREITSGRISTSDGRVVLPIEKIFSFDKLL